MCGHKKKIVNAPVPEFLTPDACNIIKNDIWHGCFPVNFAKFLRTPFLQNISGRRLLLVVKALMIFKKKRQPSIEIL